MKELDENQLNNVTGGNGSQEFDQCFQACMKHLNHTNPSAEDETQCTKECSETPRLYR